MGRDGKSRELDVELLSGGTHAVWCYPFGRSLEGVKTESVSWKEVEIEKGVFMIFAVSKKSDRIAIHSVRKLKK